VKDAAALTVALADLVPGTQVAALVPLGSGPRARTYRADVIADGRSQSWVVKYFPEDSDHARQEFACQERLRGTVGIVPELITADSKRRILVVESLQPAVDLFVALRRSVDPFETMRVLGDLTSRLVTATSTESFDGVVATEERAALIAAWPRVEAWSRSFGVDAPSAVGATVAALGERYAHPTVASLTQGDPAPSNVVFTPDGQARLVDFEYGAERQALSDVVQWWIRCPLPEPWFEALIDRVRAELLAARVYRDADAFDDDLSHAATYAALYMFTWLPISATVSDDPPWVGRWHARQALLSSSSRGARAARAVPALAPIHAWLARLNEALQQAWPASGDGAPDWQDLVGKAG
jgi:hypothetical protein